MLNKKQVNGLEDFSDLVITGYEKNGNLITLTRADGTHFLFTVAASNGSEGTKGPDGDTGPQGDSAYTSYVNNGRTTAASETAWINSLKGATGDPGSNGINGSVGDTGPSGTTPVFEVGTVTTLSAGATPTANLSKNGNTYQINVGIPQGAAGSNAEAGTTPTLTIGTVSTVANNGTPTISISQSGNTYTLNLGIPRGANGANGSGSGANGTNGTEPTVNFNVTMGSSTAVSKSVSGNTWTINLTVPNGAKGDTGPTGSSGSSGSSNVSVIPCETSNSDDSFFNRPDPTSKSGGTSANGILTGWIIKSIYAQTCYGYGTSWGSSYYYLAQQMGLVGRRESDNGLLFTWIHRCVINDSNYFKANASSPYRERWWYF